MSDKELERMNVLISDFQYEDMEGTVAEVVLWAKVGTQFKNPVISNYWDDVTSAELRVEEAEVQMAKMENRKFFKKRHYSHDDVIKIIRENEKRLAKKFMAVATSKPNLQVFKTQNRKAST